MADQVVVFIDYQNVYRRARGAFFDHRTDRAYCGQIHPLKLGELLVKAGKGDRELKEVRVYRGMPVNRHDPKGYGATRRQLATWDKLAPQLKYFTRDLRYANDDGTGYQGPPQEKGIDVALAVDFATMAGRKQFDVGILFSVDTDLKPALEYVVEQRRAWGKPRAEVAAWSPKEGYGRRLSAKGGNLHCHWLNEGAYRTVCDHTDYTLSSR